MKLVLVVIIVLLISHGDILAASSIDGAKEKQEHQDTATSYGVDVSIPIHHRKVTTNYARLPHNADPINNPIPDEYKGMPIQPLGNKQSFYEEIIQSWKKSLVNEGYDPSEADGEEEFRIASNLAQPAMSINFTETGYKKLRLPVHLTNVLSQFWDANKDRQVEEYEINVVNQWSVPTTMVSLENESLKGGGQDIRKAIWDGLREIVGSWTGQELIGSSLYGIRVYKEGNVLFPHVDRFPLICSAIINVAQDVDEDWPLEVYGRDGKAINITMEPGDLLLYESHSLIHGRPFPLKGRFYANIFVHFEPKYDNIARAGEIPPYIRQDVSPEMFKRHYLEILYELGGEVDDEVDEESYDEWGGRKETWDEKFWAAYRGDINTLRKLIDEDKTIVNQEDKDGWMMLDYAIISGNVDTAKFLIKNGAVGAAEDILEMAMQKFDDNSSFKTFLKRQFGDSEYVDETEYSDEPECTDEPEL